MGKDLENAYKTIDFLTENKYDPNGFDRDDYNANGLDRNGLDRSGIKGTRKNSSKIKTSNAKSFKDQKGKGYVDLPILNSSKELISNTEQLINNLYKNKQITSEVYNISNKAITYKNDS